MHTDDMTRWQPEHGFLGTAHATHETRTRIVIGLTVAMMVGEIAAGMAFGSMALLADGWHMATHAGALGLAAFGYAYSRRYADDPRFSFGTGKVGDLAGFSSALILAVIAALMAYESVVRLLAPQAIAFDEAIAVAALGLVVNLASAWLLGAADHDHHDHDGHDHPHDHHADHNIRSAYLHVLADTLTSVLAIVALVCGRVWGLAWLDPIMGVVGGIVIARWSLRLMRDTARVLLDCDPAPALAARIRRLVESRDDDRVADLHVWRVGPGHLAVILSVVTHRAATPADYKTLIAPVVASRHVTVEVNVCS